MIYRLTWFVQGSQIIGDGELIVAVAQVALAKVASFAVEEIILILRHVVVRLSERQAMHATSGS